MNKAKASRKPKDDAKARKARANRLMKDVQQLLSGESPKPAAPVLTPRAFIHRRMRELATKEQRGGKK